MMKKLIWLLLLPLVGALHVVAQGGPFRGPYVMEPRVKVPAAVGANPGVHVLKEKFRGGQRACVIALGSHEPVVALELVVYDAKDRIVDQDKGEGDSITAIWYPPRDGEYKIEIRNPGNNENTVYVVVK